MAFCGKRNHQEDIMRLERRPFNMCWRHAIRRNDTFGKTIVILTDNIPLALVVTKCCASSHHVIQSCRVVCVCNDCSVTLPYKLVGLLQNRILQMHHLGSNGLMLVQPVHLVKQHSRRSPESRLAVHEPMCGNRDTLCGRTARPLEAALYWKAELWKRPF